LVAYKTFTFVDSTAALNYHKQLGRIACRPSNFGSANKSVAPDFFMTDVIYVQMNEDGVLSDRIYTPKINHYPDNDTSVFEDPYINMLDKNNQFWEISAKNGKSIGGSDIIYFWDNVKIHQLPSLQGGPTASTRNNELSGMLVTSSAVTIYPHRRFAETNKPVKMVQAGSVVNAVGAELDLKDAKMKLLSKIEGQYDSSKK
jgi:lipopolysaccharide export system protein LptC